jgi:hypothetical protein
MSIELARMLMAMLLLAVLAAGLGIAWTALHGRQRIRELAFQERIAMIEKGLVPSPETDPAGFDALLARRGPSAKAIRYRTAGLILTGFGMAVTVLIFFVVPEIRGIALGVGGSLTVFGLTILGNGLLLASDDVEGSGRNTMPRG